MNKLILILLLFLTVQVKAQQHRLPGDTDLYSLMGESVDIEGDVAVVGVPFGTTNNANEDSVVTGFAYVYKFNGVSWEVQQKLVSDDIAKNDQFGYQAKVFQKRIFVSANKHDAIIDGSQIFNVGAVYVFEEIEGQWLQTAKINQSTVKIGDFFGQQIEVGVNRLFISKPGIIINTGVPAGVIHVFDLIAGEWIETAIIENDLVYQDFNHLGMWGMSFNEGRLAVSILTYTDETYSGVVQIYQQIDGDWVLQDSIGSPLDQSNDYFASNISLRGNKILINSPAEISGADDGFAGAAYLYEMIGDQWTMTRRFAAENPDAFENFSSRVALGVDQIFISTRHSYTEDGFIDEGVVFVYDLVETNWVLVETLEAEGNHFHNEFGIAMALDYDRLIVGASWTFFRSGAAYVFEIQPNSDRFEINQGLNGNWYNPETSGQGIFLDVKPELDYAYLGWFTYDTLMAADDEAGQIGAAGQRWLVGNGVINQSTSSITFDLFYAAGGIFDNNQAVTLSDPNPNGSMTMVFEDDCGHAQVSYEIPSQNLSGSYAINRASAGSLGLCSAFAQTATIRPADTFDVSLNGHWFNPDTQGQGLFVEQFVETTSAFMGWFTYDTTLTSNPVMSQVGEEGQRWLVGSGQVNADNSNVLDFDLLYSAGGLFDDPTEVTVEGAGDNATLSIEFITCSIAQVNYDIPAENISGSYAMVKLLTDVTQPCPAAQ